jgi:hypothetical protein
MSDVAGLTDLDLDEQELETLKPWAKLFDEYTRRNPPTPGDRYTALEFIEWLLLERRARSREQITEHRRRERQTRHTNHQLRALAAG